MAKDPVRDLFGTFPLIALLKRAAAETVGIWAVMSWLVRIYEKCCVAGYKHDGNSKLGTRNFVGSFFEPFNTSIMLYVVVCDVPVRDLCEVVGQMGSLKRCQILSNAMFRRCPCMHLITISSRGSFWTQRRLT
jgi:hypothetical protein